MGKKILVQRRGRGSPTFRAASHKRHGDARFFPFFAEEQRKDVIKYKVVDLIHEPGRGTPLAKIVHLESGKTTWLPAVEGMHVGQIIEEGPNASLHPGNILPLAKIPEGMPICNIERIPGSGGDFARASGARATISSRQGDRIFIKLPSRKTHVLPDKCRAMIGIIAAGGRTELPFLKAGKKYHLMHAKGHKYPKSRGVAMNPVSHPYGGGAHQHPGKPTTTSRHAPPGRKVGLIAARRTGRRRGKQQVETKRKKK